MRVAEAGLVEDISPNCSVRVNAAFSFRRCVITRNEMLFINVSSTVHLPRGADNDWHVGAWNSMERMDPRLSPRFLKVFLEIWCIWK